MKWVKTAIGAVIAIAVIPMIALAATKAINQTKIEKVVFTVLDEEGNITIGTNEKINKIGKIGEDVEGYCIMINLKNIYVNNIKKDNVRITCDYTTDIQPYSIIFYEDGFQRSIDIEPQDEISYVYFDDSSIEIGDLVDYNFILEFEVNSLSPTIKTLITLIPLIFVSSIIILIYKKQSNL